MNEFESLSSSMDDDFNKNTTAINNNNNNNNTNNNNQNETSDVNNEIKYLFKNARYFLIKSNNHENVNIAKTKVSYF